ncbi:MAG: preQ(1) synthase [Proteobacteria bacterium]|nr:preQ(1) synthase [Pseudomonadota bacterium]
MNSMSGRTKKELAGVSHLGKETKYGFSYDPSLLEAFPNKNPGNVQWVTFVCTEFTSLCPLTGQPDFARIFINYIADKKMVESKALKLYIFSFRNHGDFHEDCIQKICNELTSLLKPRYLEVIGEFTPRGGIAIYPFSSAHNGEKRFQKLQEERLLGYAPGKYTMELGKPY